MQTKRGNVILCVLAMGMKTGVGEALAIVLAEEATLAQEDVVDLVARTLAVELVPFLSRYLALP